MNLNKLNCMNYHVSDASNDHWYACNGLRSLYTYSKVTNIPLRVICETLLSEGQIVLNSPEDEYYFVLTMI